MLTPRTLLRRWLLLQVILWMSCAQAASILFVGNSFTFAYGSAARYYRANTVTDLNGQGIGGVPALFKSFAQQQGLPYEVFLETQGGSGLDWHIAHKRDVIDQRAWDVVVLQGYSTLDAAKPGDPSALVASATTLAQVFHDRNARVDVRLMATWSRADQTFEASGHWYGKPIDAMAIDVRAGYDLAAIGNPNIRGVIPVGEAFNRAMRAGVAQPNPYLGVDAGKLNLWAYDHYHASTYGYYLQALVVFGGVTGIDPRQLGVSECSRFELGLSAAQVQALQQVAYEQLVDSGLVKSHTLSARPPEEPVRCIAQVSAGSAVLK